MAPPVKDIGIERQDFGQLNLSLTILSIDINADCTVSLVVQMFVLFIAQGIVQLSKVADLISLSNLSYQQPLS